MAVGSMGYMETTRDPETGKAGSRTEQDQDSEPPKGC